MSLPLSSPIDGQPREPLDHGRRRQRHTLLPSSPPSLLRASKCRRPCDHRSSLLVAARRPNAQDATAERSGRADTIAAVAIVVVVVVVVVVLVVVDVDVPMPPRTAIRATRPLSRRLAAAAFFDSTRLVVVVVVGLTMRASEQRQNGKI